MLEVHLHNRRVGRLIRKDNGNLQFRYEPEYLESPNAVPLGQILPLQGEAFPHRACKAFFDNLLPEEDVRKHVAAVLGISASNDYRLLERLGGDCAGAVTLIPEGSTSEDLAPEVRQLSDDQLAQLVSSLDDRPLAVDATGKPRLSLAGAQPKVPIIFDGKDFALPMTGEPPTTHILKPQVRFPDLVDNEFFCMRLARAVELPVAPVERYETSDGTPFLLVARYDRDLTRDPIHRLHQEDLCQALGKLPDEKYQAEEGPTVRDCMDLLNQVSAVPAQDRSLLWSALVFNYLIGNCDAHGKNFSLLYESTAPHLAPLYDLVSTEVYDLSRVLAMSIDGATEIFDTRRRSWERLAEDIGFAGIYAQRTLEELSTRVMKEAEDLASTPDHESEVVAEIASGIRERAKAVR